MLQSLLLKNNQVTYSVSPAVIPMQVVILFVLAQVTSEMRLHDLLRTLSARQSTCGGRLLDLVSQWLRLDLGHRARSRP